MRRGSRKKQDTSSSREEAKAPLTASGAARRQQPPQEILLQQRKKHQDEVTSLTTKNYRLAKELVCFCESHSKANTVCPRSAILLLSNRWRVIALESCESRSDKPFEVYYRIYLKLSLLMIFRFFSCLHFELGYFSFRLIFVLNIAMNAST